MDGNDVGPGMGDLPGAKPNRVGSVAKLGVNPNALCSGETECFNSFCAVFIIQMMNLASVGLGSNFGNKIYAVLQAHSIKRRNNSLFHQGSFPIKLTKGNTTE